MLVSLDGAFAVWETLALALLGPLTVVSVLIQAAQVGVYFCWSSLELRWSRLNLTHGIRRILGVDPGAESLFPSGLLYELLKSSGLLSVMLGAGGLMIAFLVKPLYAARFSTSDEVRQTIVWTLLRVAGSMAFIGVVAGAIDLLVARFRQRRRLMMDAQELKRELRESEGDAELKGMRKQAHQELLRHADLNAVRGASLIVVGRAPATDRPK